MEEIKVVTSNTSESVHVRRPRGIRTSREARLWHIADALAICRVLPKHPTAVDVIKAVAAVPAVSGKTTLQRTVACILGVRGVVGGTPSHMKWLYNDAMPDDETVRRDCIEAEKLCANDLAKTRSPNQRKVTNQSRAQVSGPIAANQQPVRTTAHGLIGSQLVAGATPQPSPHSTPTPPVGVQPAAVRWTRQPLLTVLAGFLVAPTTTPPEFSQVASELAVSTNMPLSAVENLMRSLDSARGDFLAALSPAQRSLLSDKDVAAAEDRRSLLALADQGRDEGSDGLFARLAGARCENVLSVRTDRRGQGLFRAVILRNYEWRCCVSGFSLPQLLEASHIAPWNEFESRRNDPANGLCLNTFLHAAFDACMFTITPSGTVFVRHDIRSKFVGTNKAEWGLLCQYHNRRIRPARYFKPDPALLAAHNRRSGVLAEG